MDVKKAFNLIKQILAVYKGTLEEHTTLQTAISKVEEELNKDKKK